MSFLQRIILKIQDVNKIEVNMMKSLIGNLQFRGDYSAQAAIIKYHRLGGFNNRKLFSHGSGGYRPRSRCQQGWFHLRSLSLAC